MPMTTAKRLERLEYPLFLLMILINAIPYVTGTFFPSMDGASHLTNTNIIRQLWFYDNEFFRQFFVINPEPVPNWTSHLFLALTGLFLPPWAGEKMLIIILLGATPLAFRALIRTINPRNAFLSFLIFPFTHPMFLFFGFFNFCLSVLLFIVTLNFWIKSDQKNWNLKRGFLLFLLIAFTYFSHILAFGVLLITIAVHILTRLAWSLTNPSKDFRTSVRTTIRRIMVITATAAIPLALFVYFFLTRPGTRDIKFIPKGELLEYLYTIRPLITYNPALESRVTIPFFILLILVALAGIILQINVRRSKKLVDQVVDRTVSENGPATHHHFWLPVTLTILTALYFFLPNDYGTASYTNLRIGMILFLLFIVWLSVLKYKKYLGVLIILTAIFFNGALNRIYQPSLKDLRSLVTECYKAGEVIRPNSLVLPLYFMDNWFTGHFVDYAAVEKPVVMVYNYECESGYFPVIWNQDQRLNYYLGTPENKDRYIHFEIIPQRKSLPLDYVLILGSFDPEKDWFSRTLNAILQENCRLVYQEGHCRVYEHLKVAVK